MRDARLASSFEVGALRRLAEAAGGAAIVARKGDDERGQILLLISERGTYLTFLERALQPTGIYAWTCVGPTTDQAEFADSFVQRRVKFDSDLWLIDLDVPHGERFIAQIRASG